MLISYHSWTLSKFGLRVTDAWYGYLEISILNHMVVFAVLTSSVLAMFAQTILRFWQMQMSE